MIKSIDEYFPQKSRYNRLGLNNININAQNNQNIISIEPMMNLDGIQDEENDEEILIP